MTSQQMIFSSFLLRTPTPHFFLIIIIIVFYFFLVLFVSKFVHPTPTFLSFDSDMTRSDATPTRLDPIRLRFRDNSDATPMRLRLRESQGF